LSEVAGVPFTFGDYALDPERRELRRGAALVEVTPQVFDILAYLIANRDRVVSKDDLIASVWHGRIVSDSTLTSQIATARKAIGDAGGQQAYIKTIARRGVRFVGAVAEGPPSARPIERGATALRQEVHFCTGSDGTRIAHAAVGRGPTVVKTANWLNHLEYDWESPVFGPLWRAIAAEHRLVRYDARGNGLSDWDVDELSFDAFVRDLETVVDATGLQRFALFGLSQGCAISVAYAAKHPERVSHLILCGGFVRGRKRRGSADETANADAIVQLMRQGWGQDNPAFRQLFTSLFIPDGTEQQTRWFNDLQRITTSPENAVRLRQVVDEIDIGDLLPRVKAPTLVLHVRGDAVQPFDEGKRLAAGIPGARFVALEGRNHVPLQGEPAWERLVAEMRDFVRS
jgi:pimeloyl-ACP methyl ester carboxylesterase/DNA-binding winged helix-turn-helix (wHTH) protein